MTEFNQIYKCEICGNIVAVLHAGAGELVCCGQPMKLQAENTVDAAHEKHVPVIERTDSGIVVKVGAEPHPMTTDHHIEWIELQVDNRIIRHFLRTGDTPEAVFQIDGREVSARAWCNLHGLWKG